MSDRDDAVRPEFTKADPSRNATTHGLTARRPLCEQEAERHRILIDHWTSKHRPETEAEEALVQMAAAEYVRYLRCVQADERLMGPNAKGAQDGWRDKRRHAIRRKAQDLREDPERVAAELQESAFGIDWMLGHWRRLLGQIDAGTGWSGDDLTTAMHLLGRRPLKPAEDDVDGYRLWDTVWAACPSALDPRAKRGLVDAEATHELRALVADRIERLERLRPTAWEEVEGPQADAIESAAMLDTSKEGQLRDRYRREAFGAVLRGMGMLTRIKVERSKMDDRMLRQERLATSSRGPEPSAWQEAQRRAAAARPEAAEAVAPSANTPQRNGPPEPGSSLEVARRNPNETKEIGVDSGERSPTSVGRTEAHPGMTEGPSVSPIGGHPGGRMAHPGHPTRPGMPDRAS